MTTRKALGRGLGALLSAEGTAPATDDANEISIELIDASSLQPRSVFDEAKLNELAASITANGVVQPLLVRRRGERFELIAGERRWRAAQIAGLTKVPAVIRNVSDDKVLELALIENIQREDLNPIEEARAYKKLIDTVGLTQETVAERVGRDRSYVTNYLRLLRLPEDLQELLQSGRISTGHARAILGTDQADLQRRLARKVIEQDLSVRATERLVRNLVEPPARTKRAPKREEGDANVRAAETKLRRQFGTQVRIVLAQGSQSGRIEIEFYNASDLDRLYSLLIQAAPRHGTL
ncbi:MAG TPA: ParB/RepB/Spo0J family partition protein [Pyrinomonadaceae bacterium]|nr:ParB/RepB/Spo0J family partition protein [Pyrinomonadaceae bacterium]